jgi:hypothetical protein
MSGAPLSGTAPERRVEGKCGVAIRLNMGMLCIRLIIHLDIALKLQPVRAN